MNTVWKDREEQPRQIHVSATEMPAVERSFKKVLHEVVHGVLVAQERPRTRRKASISLFGYWCCPSSKRPHH